MNGTQILKSGGLAMLLLACSGLATADDQPTAARLSEALRVTTDAAKAYQFELLGEPPRPLAFHPESILRWSNPEAGEIFGNVFVWTRDGRPEVIGSIHQWFSPFTHSSHEFHSLATGPLRGQRDGQPVWDSRQPGVALRPVPDQDQVAELPPARLRQMRAIARQFTVQKTDREGVSSELRLLSQPVYRYAENKTSLLDGGLFAFVQGTDPEALLLVEARRANDSWQWRYALARMNSVRFVAKYRDRQVWSVEVWPWSRVKNGSEPFTQFGPFNRPGPAN